MEAESYRATILQLSRNQGNKSLIRLIQEAETVKANFGDKCKEETT